MRKAQFKLAIISASCFLFLFALLHINVIEKKMEDQTRIWTRDEWELMPVPSKISGYYHAPFYLSFSSPVVGAEIRYTTDCSEPTVNSLQYIDDILINDRSEEENRYSLPDYSSVPDVNYGDNHVPVDKITIIRAALFENDKQLGPTSTFSYLVGMPNHEKFKDLPIVSVVADSFDLFDEKEGIYANWAADNAIEAHVDYFRKDFAFDFGQDILLSIQGRTSRVHPQKGLNIVADASTKEPTIKNVFEQNHGEALTGWTVLTGFDYCKIRDSIASLMGNDLEVETFHYIPCSLFLNGEYWGVYYLKEQLSNDNLASFHQIESDNVVVFKDNERKRGMRSDERLFTSLTEFYQAHDFSDDKSLDELDQIMSIDSLIDYCCIESYINNEDWPMNNLAIWRTRTLQTNNPFGDCRWRFILYDTNYWNCMLYNSNASVLSLLATNQYCAPLFANKRFCKRFATRMFDIMNTVASYDYIEPQIDRLSDQIADVYPLSQSRIWKNPGEELSYYSDKIKEFFYYRKDFVVDELKAAFQLGGLSCGNCC